ncbi:MAG: hypothetical protein IKP05_03665 [Alphaproteobacteria bacterium]|nr:hypothetical protein [Alphaproteobacteria bacterium]
MNFDKNFQLENMLMSVIGHLVLVALMVTSFAILVHRAMLVAPDRIEIMEIDLNSVTVSRDDTKLYNTVPPEEKKTEEKKEEKSKPEPEKIESEKPIEKPSLVDSDMDKKKEEKKAEEKKDPEPIAPRKKMVVRVNRESVSLNRTLNVSVIDALRVAMTRCWVIDKNRPDISDIRAVAHLTMRKNGTVRDMWFESAARAETDPAFAYVLETIRAAINTCQPLRMLPANDFANWEKIQLTFYPTSGKVM